MLNNGEGTGRKKRNLCHGIGLKKKIVGKAKLNHKTCLIHLMSEEYEAGMDHRRDVVERDMAY